MANTGQTQWLLSLKGLDSFTNMHLELRHSIQTQLSSLLLLKEPEEEHTCGCFPFFFIPTSEVVTER